MVKLNFKYCECGCKCYTASKKGKYYSIFWDLERDKFYLFYETDHIGKFKSYKKAQKAANKHYKELE